MSEERTAMRPASESVRMSTTMAKRGIAGMGMAALLLLGACGQPGGEVTAGGGTEESADPGAQDDADGHDAAMQDVQLGDVAVSIPADWVESPDSELDGDWTEGFDDAAEDPAIRIRMAPMINDSPHPDIAEAELVTRAMAGGYYGSEWEGVHRTKEDIPGAFRGFVTDFTYVSSDG